MWLSFSGEILAYQMRTLSDKRGGMTKGGILTRKENKDMEDGGRDRRMQSAALEATSPELYVGRQGRRLPWAAELRWRGLGDPLMMHLPPLIHAQKKTKEYLVEQGKSHYEVQIRWTKNLPILTRSRRPCAGMVDDQNPYSCSSMPPLFFQSHHQVLIAGCFRISESDSLPRLFCESMPRQRDDPYVI